ncbi:hypothetical protein HIM_03946 [Hirsutella minnesotensis 3608]|uniref:Uncharacterized protein n=1 Tax=Hirsutella minnesotensis 3608 TaxID=1043627 RepID=A0A0F7ZQ45_9HYPO|nr:hypothetical protein HIM_03946 [Hirsutella minnesotensis 3608]
MTAAEDIISQFHNGLSHHIKPREQVNYIRRILALHLGSLIGEDAAASQPLSLSDTNSQVDATSDQVKGVHKVYLEALRENVLAKRAYDEAAGSKEATEKEPSHSPPTDGSDLLERHLALLKLRQKRDCLQAIRQTLNSLDSRPVSRQDPADTDRIFRSAMSLPSVPKSVVNSFVPENDAFQPDLGSRIKELERALLQARLLSKQREKLLAESKARCEAGSRVYSNAARLQALTATRGELIRWIEDELSKASTGEAEAESLQRRAQRQDGQPIITDQLEQVGQKYAAYVSARKGILDLVSQERRRTLSPPRQTCASSIDSPDPETQPVDYFLTPYLKTLLLMSSHEKSILTHKSHANSVLKGQVSDVRQALDRLAEESQLLPSYPTKSLARGRSGAVEEMGRPQDDSETSKLVRPWVMAAESAKIATLEAVAEKIEGGQVALENSMKFLQDIDQLCGRDAGQPNEGHPSGQDPETQPATGRARSPVEERRALKSQPTDPWSRLHGNLGSISHDETVLPRR